MSSSNGTTQVDHILVSPFELFIVETKNKMDTSDLWEKVFLSKCTKTDT
jgi:hypothetical protein